MPVHFTPELLTQIGQLEKRYPRLRDFIVDVLAQDPRPAYRKEEEAGKTYAVWLLDFNVRWRVTETGFEVFAWNPVIFFSSLWHLYHTGKLNHFLCQAGVSACSNRRNGTVTTCVLANICSPH